MPHYCVCAGCTNSGLSGHRGHRFPDRKRKGASFRAWLRFVQVRRRDFSAASVTENTVVCSAHFGEEDYVSGHLMEFRMGFRSQNQVRLLAGAVPSIHTAAAAGGHGSAGHTARPKRELCAILGVAPIASAAVLVDPEREALSPLAPQPPSELHCGSQCIIKPLHRSTELPQQHVCKEEEVLTDQQLCNQEKNCSLDQEGPEPPQIKEEQEELCTSQEGQQLVLKLETDTLTLTPTYEERDHRLEKEDPELPQIKEEQEELCTSQEGEELVLKLETDTYMVTPTFEGNLSKSDHQLLSNNSHVAGSQDQKGGKHGDSGSTRNVEPKSKERQQNDNAYNSNLSEIYHNTDTGKKSLKCDTCGKAFSYKSKLDMHLRIHTGEKPYPCKTCGKDFICGRDLSVHMRTHTGEKPYLCETCGKRFLGIQTWKKHMSIHTGEKAYTCTICGKDFRINSHLKSHMRIHTGEKPYTCTICGKDFRTNTHLKRHVRTHTGEKPYLCKACGKRFIEKSKLKRHMETH